MVWFWDQEWGMKTSILGTTLEYYVYFGLVVLGFIIAGRIIQYIIDQHVRKLTQSTTHDWDDLVLDIVSIPIRFAFVVIGLVVGAEMFLTFPSPAVEMAYYQVVGLLILGVGIYVLVHVIDLFADRVLLRFAARTKSRLDDQLIPLVKRILKYAVVIMGLLVALDNFGYDITALLAGLGITGLAIAFAAQETIKDVFGGITIFANKSFYVGERVALGNLFTTGPVQGTVESITLRTTRIRNKAGNLVTIPNSQVASAVVENLSRNVPPVEEMPQKNKKRATPGKRQIMR